LPKWTNVSFFAMRIIVKNQRNAESKAEAGIVSITQNTEQRFAIHVGVVANHVVKPGTTCG